MVEIGRAPTQASRKCVATVRKESIPPFYSSSSTVEFRGLEGSDTKAENWSATGNRQIVEDHRELNHPVSENKGPPDAPSVCSNADHSGPIDCAVFCPWSPIEITHRPLLHAETHVHRRGTTTTRQLHRLFHQPIFPGSLLLGDGSPWHWVLCGRNP